MVAAKFTDVDIWGGPQGELERRDDDYPKEIAAP